MAILRQIETRTAAAGQRAPPAEGATMRARPKPKGRPRPAHQGHTFGPELVCNHAGCGRAWEDHQKKPTDCESPRVSQKQGRAKPDPLSREEIDRMLELRRLGWTFSAISVKTGRSFNACRENIIREEAAALERAEQ